MMKFKTLTQCIALFMLSLSPLLPLVAQAQSAKKVDLPADTVALVDGVSIKKLALDKIVSSATSAGTQVTPELRNEILRELVLREVVSAEAIRRGIERKPDFQQQLNEVKQRLLADALLNELVTQNPVSEKEILTEYERQKTSLGGDAALQYKLSQIVVASEQEGRDVVARLRKGEGFDKLATAVSKDADSKAKAGDMGWFLPLELAPVFGNVVVNLPKGGFTAAPIGFNNQWFVIKVDDTRPFKVPSLQESRPRLQAALQQQKRQKLIDDLLKKANVQLGNL
jgi:peptidyl-prolyl cis-trans isomerase C